MTVKVNRPAVTQAERLIDDGKFVWDERGAWSEDQPTARQQNAFIKTYGFGEFAKWHLGIEDSEAADTKEHYRFPYGDFENVHRCGLLAAESRAGQYKYSAIEGAAAKLLAMLDRVRVS